MDDDAVDLARRQSGISRHPLPKHEHPWIHLRHIRHHAARWADRLGAAEDVGVRRHRGRFR